MSRFLNARWPFVVCVIAQTVIFGVANVVAKLAYNSITPFWCLTLRFGLAALVFAVLFGPRIVRQLRSVSLSAWLPAAACMAVSFIAGNVALDFTMATTVGFLTALPVVFVPILSSLVFRTRYPKAFVPFQAAVVVGLYLLCSNAGTLSFGIGEILSLVAAASMAGALVFGQKGLSQLDAVSIAGSQIGMAFVLSLVCAVLLEGPIDTAAVTPSAWGIIAFLALISTCLTFFLQNVSLEKLPSTTVSLLLTSEPVFTAVFSFGLLGEVLSAAGFAGAAIIVVSVVAATYVDGRADAEPAAAPESSASAGALAAMRTVTAFGKRVSARRHAA